MKRSLSSLLAFCAGLALLPNCKQQGGGSGSSVKQTPDGAAPAEADKPNEVRMQLVPMTNAQETPGLPPNFPLDVLDDALPPEALATDFKDPKQVRAFIDAVRARNPPRSAWEELDDIYGVMALAVVAADFQEKTDPCPDGNAKACTRGHNIGGIVVNGEFEVVNFERNSNNALCSGTQHGEVRTILKQLYVSATTSLPLHQIYTSLEPCMMCSGMMMQQNLLRTVYMQTDDGFGKNLERLLVDTTGDRIGFRPLQNEAKRVQLGYPPGPRGVISSMSRSPFRKALDRAWFKQGARGSLTDFLKGPEAKAIYMTALAYFLDYPLYPKFAEPAQVTFFAASDNQGNPVPGRTFTLKAPNAALYAKARAFFLDPTKGVVPLVGKGTLEISENNVHALRLLEGLGDADRIAQVIQDGQGAETNVAAPAVAQGQAQLVAAADIAEGVKQGRSLRELIAVKNGEGAKVDLVRIRRHHCEVNTIR
jgi:tRNA(Arg) A34 adenosine deaminase TadA